MYELRSVLRPCIPTPIIFSSVIDFRFVSLIPSLFLRIVPFVQLSIGDIAVVARVNWVRNGSLDGIPTTIADGYPLLLSLVDRVMAEPKIVAYMAARPKN